MTDTSPHNSPHRAAQKIRAFRRAQTPAWSQEDFARWMGYSRTQVARWELGTNTPNSTAMRKFAQQGVCEPNDWYALPVAGPFGGTADAAHHDQAA